MYEVVSQRSKTRNLYLVPTLFVRIGHVYGHERPYRFSIGIKFINQAVSLNWFWSKIFFR